jgi:hypothetical protein
MTSVASGAAVGVKAVATPGVATVPSAEITAVSDGACTSGAGKKTVHTRITAKLSTVARIRFLF